MSRIFHRSRTIYDRWAQLLASMPESAPRVPYHNSLLFFKSAKGVELQDVEGNSYIDFSNCMGSILLGHNDPDVNSAFIEAIVNNRTVLTGSSEISISLAERLTNDLGEDYRVAFFTTGTDAVRAAVNVIRQATNRRLILNAGFHGWDSMWDRPAKLFEPNASGIIDSFFALPILKNLLERHHDEVAAIIISPDPIYLSSDWYQSVDMLCKEYGCYLIADEVMHGFRYQSGPSIAMYGITADIYVYSKIISGGHRLAAICGRQKLMQPAQGVTHTTGLDVLPVVASIATLKKYDRMNAPARIRDHAEKFLVSLREMIAERQFPMVVVGRGEYFLFVFGDERVETAFYQEATRAGIIFHSGDAQTPSCAFEDETYALALKRLEKVMAAIKRQFGTVVISQISPESHLRMAMRTMNGLPEFFLKDKKLRASLIKRLGEA